jgi:YesN/AraC family two-component response regulator
MKLYIKNMVSPRCKTFVRNELTKIGLRYESVELGEAEISENMSSEQFAQLETALLGLGLVIIDDVKSVLIERIKTIIIELVHYSAGRLEINLSVHLSRQLTHNYAYMATLFSETQGHTIEKFFIEHKIERVKELLIYNELSLTEIAEKMHYSSVAHLSSQFKKVTGNTASQYKRLRVKTRSMLEEL